MYLQVNAAFEELRIRARAGSGRLPKLEILRAAIQHIERLQAALRAAAVVRSISFKLFSQNYDAVDFKSTTIRLNFNIVRESIVIRPPQFYRNQGQKNCWGTFKGSIYPLRLWCSWRNRRLNVLSKTWRDLNMLRMVSYPYTRNVWLASSRIESDYVRCFSWREMAWSGSSSEQVDWDQPPGWNYLYHTSSSAPREKEIRKYFSHSQQKKD